MILTLFTTNLKMLILLTYCYTFLVKLFVRIAKYIKYIKSISHTQHGFLLSFIFFTEMLAKEKVDCVTDFIEIVTRTELFQNVTLNNRN